MTRAGRMRSRVITHTPWRGGALHGASHARAPLPTKGARVRGVARPEILFVLNSQEKKALLGKCSMEVDIGIRPVTPMDLVSTITAAKANQKNTSDEQLGTDKASENVSAAESRLLEIAAKREEIALWNLEIQADQSKVSRRPQSID